MDLDPKKGRKKPSLSTTWQQILQERVLGHLVADQKYHITVTLNSCKVGRHLSKDSLLPLASLSIWDMTTATSRSCFCIASAAWYGWLIENGLEQISSWALDGHPFPQWMCFLHHQLIKSGLSLKRRKSDLNVTQESWWDSRREECGPLI